MRICISRLWEIEQIRKEIKRFQRISDLSEKQETRIKELKRADRAYEEGGEVYHSEEEATEISLKKFRNILTHKRLNLLKELNNNQFNSISELSRHLKRDIKNIHSDLKILENFNLVKLEKRGKNVVPKTIVETITLEFFRG
jgi:predicted transcriptional regulator